jgi:hypothetical protein
MKNKTPESALVAALNEMGNVSVNKFNSHFKSKYVSLDALLDSVKPVLAKHDLALVQRLVSEEGKVGVATAFAHIDGKVFDCGVIMIKAEGLTPQHIGSAITYLRRQSIQTACGISAELDDDGGRASGTAPQPQPKQAQPSGNLDFITEEMMPAALTYLIAKGWLKEGQTIKHLKPDDAHKIASNATAFIRAINGRGNA